MRVPHEMTAKQNRDHTETETTASSQDEHNMQDNHVRAAHLREETNYVAPTISFENVSEDERSSCGESQASLGERLADLAISSQTLTRSPRLLLSPDHVVQSVEGAEPATIGDPITVRHLSNATPRPSLSPEPRTQPALRPYSDLIPAVEETLDEPHSTETEENFDIPGFGDLILQDEPIVYEVLDEPLPPGPFSDRDYQNALKSAKALTGDIFQKLSLCEQSARPGTQLYKIKQRAGTLNKLDNPASRTIGIVGDSAAGKHRRFPI